MRSELMRNIMKRCILIVACVGFFSGGAHAESLANVSVKTWGDEVWISFNGTIEGVWTAEFQTNLQDNQGNLLRDSHGNVATFTGFCVELAQGIGAESLLPVTLVAPSQVTGGLEVAWLIEHRTSYQAAYANWSPYEIAGLQLAIWEITSDYRQDRKYDLGAGNFRLVATEHPEIRDLANFYLSSLADFTISAQLDSMYRIAQNPTKQDLILNIPGDPAVATPEPTTFLLFGAGLIALAALRRKKYSKK